MACLTMLHAFAHLRHANLVSRVAIAGGLRGHVEVEFLVAGIGKDFADVVGDAAGAQASGPETPKAMASSAER